MGSQLAEMGILSSKLPFSGPFEFPKKKLTHPKLPEFRLKMTIFSKKLIFIFRFYVDVIIFEWSSFFQIQIDRKNPIGIKTVS